MLFLIYLSCLNRKLNAIANESFISEKRALLITTIAFLVVYILYTVKLLINTIVPQTRYGAGLYTTILIEMAETVLFELVPLFVIQV